MNNETSATDQPGALQTAANRFSNIFGALFSWLIFPISMVLVLHFFVFQAYHVVGTSMVPTMQDGDYLIVSKLGHTGALIQRSFGNDDKVYVPDRGEIIVFRFPRDPSKVFVKRVIGVPGDRVLVQNGKVTVFNADNPAGFDPDTEYEAPNTFTSNDTDPGGVTVEPGTVFVIGDNRSPGGSYDSREWGLLPSSYIIGDAVMRLLPVDKIRVFEP